MTKRRKNITGEFATLNFPQEIGNKKAESQAHSGFFLPKVQI